MQTLIAKLIQRGHAYRDNGGVYFSTSSCEGYGKLSGHRLNTRLPVEQQQDGGGKQCSADFVLWKAAKPDEPFWSSPWGPGRPGWHIECSAMSTHLLGTVFDIRGGGADLIFPHHENEIAQSESGFGKTPANYWLHHGLVIEEGGKLSKSRGYFVPLTELLDLHSPDTVRLFLLSKRYRKPLVYASSSMLAAMKNLTRIRGFFANYEFPGPTPDLGPPEEAQLCSRFCDAMDDDFNLPRALSLVFSEIRSINREMAGDKSENGADRSMRRRVIALRSVCQNVLGLRLDSPTEKTMGTASHGRPGRR